MRYGSICSGIEAATLAWHPLGFVPVWFSEIEKFPSAVLAHHYPHVINLGDMTTIAKRVLTGDVEAPDILVGGTPCQAFSVAGLREGLNDARGQLTIAYVRLADATDFIRQRRNEQPAIIVWENVPGVLSDKTNAFGCLLGALAGEDCELKPAGKRWTDAGCVYGPKRAIAWRILDAQYFGLAQRRRRVFLVASARKGFDPAAVLFERDGVRRDIAPSREAGKNITGSLTASAGRHGGKDECDRGTLIASTGDISHCLNAGGMGRQDYETETVIVQCGVTIHGTDPSVQKIASYDDLAQCLRARTPGNTDNSSTTVIQCAAIPIQNATRGKSQNGLGIGAGTDPMYTLDRASQHAVCVTERGLPYAIQAGALRENPNSGPDGVGVQDSIAYTIEARAEVQAVAIHENQRADMAVRRLTPLECEKLQGMPPGYTNILIRGKPAPDGPRYKSIGNSMAVTCMHWIGKRIADAVAYREVAA